MTAAESDDIEILRNLLNLGVSPDSRGYLNGTALHWAAWHGRPRAVRLLVDCGADIRATGANLGSTPLQWAIYASGNNPEAGQEDMIAVVDILIDAGSQPRGWEFASEEMRRYLERAYDARQAGTPVPR